MYMGDDPHTNNEAEYFAALEAFKAAEKLIKKPSRICVRGDSNLVIGHLNKPETCKAANLIPFNREIGKIIMASKHTYTMEHVKRDKNSSADGYANQAVTMRKTEVFDCMDKAE
jgi:ribonuclease HI